MPEKNLPAHVGIIMDGNGRWARSLGKPRSYGHRAGLKAAKKIALAASKAGLKYLTFYVFSTENWKRTKEEVMFLMQLLKHHLKKELDFYRENQLKVVHSGDLDSLPEDVKTEILDVINDTAGYTGLTINLAINYGGRNEIIRAFNKIRTDSSFGNRTITEDDIRQYLDHPEIPDPDLIIRTAGEQRLSNFLLWESAYSEYYFSSKFWPEWTEKDLLEALDSYTGRVRKYGTVLTETENE